MNTIISVKSTYEALQLCLLGIYLTRMGIFIVDHKSQSAILIKILTNYIQVISAITTFHISLNFFGDSVKVLGNPVKAMSYSLDCLLVSLTNIPIVYFRVIWSMIMPLLYMSLIFIFFGLGVLIKVLPKTTTIIYTASIYTFIYYQPNLVGSFINLASSRSVSSIRWV